MKPEVCFSFTIFWVFLVALTSKSRSPSALCISAFGLVNFSTYLHFFFFFSSRRRHTRYWRDWSSDVCSSDLPPGGAPLRRPRTRGGPRADRPAQDLPALGPDQPVRATLGVRAPRARHHARQLAAPAVHHRAGGGVGARPGGSTARGRRRAAAGRAARAAGADADGGGAALLRGPLRAADRLADGVLAQRGQHPDRPGPGPAARRADRPAAGRLGGAVRDDELRARLTALADAT